jgi:hypothetical protein
MTAGVLTDERRQRVVRALQNVVAIGGYGFSIALLVQGFQSGRWPFPGGDVTDFYAPAGDALRNGGQVYFPGFLYGPPWAIAFAAVSWLGPAAIHAIVLVLDVAALWVIVGGDLRRLGWFLWFPLIPFELAAGQLNLLIAAAIVAAQKGRTWPLAAMTLAKVWPIVALPLRDWRAFLRATALIALISVPWLHLWPEWFAALVATSAHPLGPVVPVPFVVRGALAILLLLARRPWCQALAAAIVSPGLYWGQLVVLVAPLSLFLDRGRLTRPQSGGVREPGAAADPGAPRSTTAGSEAATSGA